MNIRFGILLFWWQKKEKDHIKVVEEYESCGYIDYRYIESEINENIEKGE